MRFGRAMAEVFGRDFMLFTMWKWKGDEMRSGGWVVRYLIGKRYGVFVGLVWFLD